MLPIIIAVALLVGGGASVVAENSLPGEMLYPVKVEVNERVAGWTSLTTESKAKFDVRLLERRLNEAEELAVEGNLDAETQVQLKSRIEETQTRVYSRIDSLESEGNVEAAANVASELESTLRVYSRVLAKLAADSSDINGELLEILSLVEISLGTAVRESIDLEAKITANANISKEDAENKLNAAEDDLAEVRDFMVKFQSELSAEAQAEIGSKIADSEQTIAEGKADIEAEAYGEAFVTFHRAMRLAQEARKTASAYNRIDLLLNVDARSDVDTDVDAEVEIDTDAEVEVEAEAEAEVNSSINR